MLGIVLELFVVKEQLFAGGEYELRPAVVTLQNSVDKFHGRFPKAGTTFEIGHDLESLPVPFPCLCTSLNNKGPGRSKWSGASAVSLETRDRDISRLLKLGFSAIRHAARLAYYMAFVAGGQQV